MVSGGLHSHVGCCRSPGPLRARSGALAVDGVLAVPADGRLAGETVDRGAGVGPDEGGVHLGRGLACHVAGDAGAEEGGDEKPLDHGNLAFVGYSYPGVSELWRCVSHR